MIAALAVFVPTFLFLLAMALCRASKDGDRAARRFRNGGLR